MRSSSPEVALPPLVVTSVRPVREGKIRRNSTKTQLSDQSPPHCLSPFSATFHTSPCSSPEPFGAAVSPNHPVVQTEASIFSVLVRQFFCRTCFAADSVISFDGEHITVRCSRCGSSGLINKSFEPSEESILTEVGKTQEEVGDRLGDQSWPEEAFNDEEEDEEAPMDQSRAQDGAARTPNFAGVSSLDQGKAQRWRTLTGVTQSVFNTLADVLNEGYKPKGGFGLRDNVLIFLMRLKLGVSYSILGGIFDIHRTTVQRIFEDVLVHLHHRTNFMLFWPSREQIAENLPPSFLDDYPGTRAIIDCTEIKTETPSDLHLRSCLWSNYKQSSTVKYMVACTPDGLFSYVSPGYGGRASDPFITNDCGFLRLLESGDSVMADKGFPKITADLENIHLDVPPKLAPKQTQLTKEQSEATYKIARVRIHVERAIGRLKIFDILNNRLPTEMIKYMDYIMPFLCFLTNLDKPLIKY